MPTAAALPTYPAIDAIDAEVAAIIASVERFDGVDDVGIKARNDLRCRHMLALRERQATMIDRLARARVSA